ncbi:MAG: hypothetical protein JWP57_1182 [Spirosoma sp.]|nr:hypothetical protein [Spirosoma sp.]
MAEPKKNRPRTLSLLSGPDVQKAAQEAFHATAKLPESPDKDEPDEPVAQPLTLAEPEQELKSTAVESTSLESVQASMPVPAKARAKKLAKPPVEEDKTTQNVAVSASVHQAAKLAATHYGQSLRDLVEEAIEAHPNVKKIRKLLSQAEE